MGGGIFSGWGVGPSAAAVVVVRVVTWTWWMEEAVAAAASASPRLVAPCAAVPACAIANARVKFHTNNLFYHVFHKMTRNLIFFLK